MGFLRPVKAVCILIVHDAQGPQRKLRALLFVVLVVGSARSAFALWHLRRRWRCMEQPLGLMLDDERVEHALGDEAFFRRELPQRLELELERKNKDTHYSGIL